MNLTPEQISEIAAKAAIAAVQAAMSGSIPQPSTTELNAVEMTKEEEENHAVEAMRQIEDRLSSLAKYDGTIQGFLDEHLRASDKPVLEWCIQGKGVTEAVLGIIRAYIAQNKALYREATSTDRIASTKTKTESAIDRAAGH